MLFRHAFCVFQTTNEFRRTAVRGCSTLVQQKFVPRRAVMYVPGDDERKLRKIPALNADCAVLECEDGVALNRKDVARETICRMLGEMDFGRSEVAVRINSLDSGLAEADMVAILQAKRLPSSILFPKVHTPRHVEWFAERLRHHLGQRQVVDKLNLIIYVESCLGLLNVKDICSRAQALSKDYPLKLDAIVFGADDYIADAGALRTQRNKEVLCARQLVVAAARAFGVQAIDMVYIDYQDAEGLKRQSLEGAEWGFTGKQVIHPSQLAVVHRSFSPPKEKVKWAREVIRLFKEHQSEGKGAFTFNGAMVDRPLLLQAQNIAQLADAIGMDPT